MRILIRKIRITPGGYLLLSGLVFLLDWELLLMLFGNILIHELGHLKALERCGANIRQISFGGSGFCIEYGGWHLTSLQQCLCAAAGPIMGLLVSVAASLLGNLTSNSFFCLFAGVGLILSLFNLLPARPLDGWRMLYAVLPNLAHAVSCFTAFIVLMAGIGLMFMGYGTVLAMMGVYLLLCNEPPKRGRYLPFGWI